MKRSQGEKRKRHLHFVVVATIIMVGMFTTAVYATTYETEGNDTVQTANQMITGESAIGSTVSSADTDWYKFSIPSTGKVYVNFKHSTEQTGGDGGDWLVGLYKYDPNTFQTTEIYSFWSNPEDAYLSTPNIGLPAGTYYIQVDSRYGYSTTDYYVTAYFAASNTWEKEFNNERSTANSISRNITYKGSTIDSDDTDWFKFSTTYSGKVWLNFKHSTEQTGGDEGDWLVGLYKYNPNTFEITEITSIWSSPEDAYLNTTGIGLPAGTYYIKVEPRYGYSSTDYYITAMVPTTAPTSPKASSASYNSIKVSWSPVSGATGYGVFRYNSSTGSYAKIKSLTGTTYTDTARVTGKTYSYKVYAYKTVAGTNIYSPASSVVSAKAIPSKPILTLSKYSTTSIKVSWTGVSGATKYQIFRATSATGTYTYLYTASSTARSWVDTGRTPGKYYYYKVRAYHLEGTTKVYGYSSTIKSIKI